MYYPIILKTAGQRVVVIGGGEVAEAKARSLVEAGARVTVVSPQVTPALRLLAEAGAIAVIERAYEPADVRDALFVIAATRNAEVQERVCRDAREHRVLVNVVDEPDRCDFIMPSVLRRDDLIVAVSTSGQSPAFAAWLRRKLGEFLTADFGRVTRLLGSVRVDVRRRFKTVSERRRVYQKILDSDIVNWVHDCDDAAAKARVRRIIEEP